MKKLEASYHKWRRSLLGVYWREKITRPGYADAFDFNTASVEVKSIGVARIFDWGCPVLYSDDCQASTKFNFVPQLLKLLYILLPTILRKLSSTICVTVCNVHCTSVPCHP